jgi:hypothetical protein
VPLSPRLPAHGSHPNEPGPKSSLVGNSRCQQLSGNKDIVPLPIYLIHKLPESPDDFHDISIRFPGRFPGLSTARV